MIKQMMFRLPAFNLTGMHDADNMISSNEMRSYLGCPYHKTKDVLKRQ